MVAICLTRPGRRYVYDEGSAYRVYRHVHGDMEIERIGDGATAFFQGDDAAQLERELSWDGAECDRVCDEYSEVLEPPCAA